MQGFLAAGHVCTDHGLRGIRADRRQLPRADRRDRLRAARHPARASISASGSSRQGRAEVENQYSRSVRRDGNRAAQAVMREVFRRDPAALARHRRDRRERARPCRRLCATSMPNAGSATSRTRRRRSRATASAAWCCAASASPAIARPSAHAARRSIRSAPRWSPSEGACAAYYRYRRSARGGESTMTDEDELRAQPARYRAGEGETIQLAHGGGGRAMARLLDTIIRPAFADRGARAAP